MPRFACLYDRAIYSLPAARHAGCVPARPRGTTDRQRPGDGGQADRQHLHPREERPGAQLCYHVEECGATDADLSQDRSEEHTSELQSLMRISYAVFCLKKKNITVFTDYFIYH